LSLIASAGFLPVGRIASLLRAATTLGSPIHPRSGPLALGESRLHGLLVAEQAVEQRVVETFNDWCL